jgi:hypothetical protein
MRARPAALHAAGAVLELPVEDAIADAKARVVARLARDAGFDMARHLVDGPLNIMQRAMEAVQQEDRQAASAALLAVEF